jgi:carbamoyltransferase
VHEYAASRFDYEDAPLAIGRLGTGRRIVRELQYHAHGLRNGLYTQDVGARVLEVGRLWYRKKVRRDRALHRLSIDTRYFMGRPVDYGFDHHHCHAASAYYCSGFEEAVVVTVDGVGDTLSATINQGRGHRLERKQFYYMNQSIAGQAYEVVTAMLGFDPDRHPGKVTGLAAYVDPPERLVGDLDAWLQSQYRAGARDNWFDRIHTQDAGQQLQQLRKLREGRFGAWSREEIAAAIQRLLERDVLGMIAEHVPNPEEHKVALAGGVFANVKLNQRVKAMGFRAIFVQPAMGDDGLALGSAVLAGQKKQPEAPHRLHDVYLGPGYRTGEVRAALEGARVPYEEFEPSDGELERRIAELLHRGWIVARFQGRMELEFGPRALGNRSILYRATDPSVNDWLNERLKRSEFMPFAPVTLSEHADACYVDVAGAEHAAEFMTVTFKATDRMVRESPACVHVDGTVRPQLLREEVNPSLHRTLTHYFRLSGIPSIINTSFNMHEEPIICNPDEAIDAFLRAELDALAIEDFLVVNPNRREGLGGDGTDRVLPRGA